MRDTVEEGRRIPESRQRKLNGGQAEAIGSPNRRQRKVYGGERDGTRMVGSR